MVNEERGYTAVDVTVEDQGSVVLFVLNTEAARASVQEQVQVDPWQWLGPSALAVEARFAGDLVAGMIDGGVAVV